MPQLIFMGFVWETVWHSCCVLRYCSMIRSLREYSHNILLERRGKTNHNNKHLSILTKKSIFLSSCTPKCEGGITPFLYHNCSMNKFIEMLCLVIYFDWIWRKIISETSFCIIRYETREGMTQGTKDFECDTFSRSIRSCSAKVTKN